MLTFVTRFLLTATAAAALAAGGFAQSLPDPDPGSQPGGISDPGISSLTISSTGRAGAVLNNAAFTLQPGQFRDFNLAAGQNINQAQKLAIALYAPNQNLSGTLIVPFFAVPGARFSVSAEVINGADFLFPSQGGGVVTVFGRQGRDSRLEPG